jgi:hypothetical protein
MKMRQIQRIGRKCLALGAATAMATAIPLIYGTAALASSQPIAHAAGSCRKQIAGKIRLLGPTYAETLNVSGTSCASGEKLITAYNKCRLRSGGAKGYCHSTVLGFRCSEKRPQTSSVSFIGDVSCTAGRVHVAFTYVEFT